MRKKVIQQYFLLSIILILAVVLRLYKINIPLADHHSWRQADTAAVARNFIKEGWNFWQPKIDNMTPLAHPDMPNPQRLFLVEPPIYQTIVGGFYHVFGVREELARLVSVMFSLGSIIFLYLLALTYVSKRVALLSAFFFTVLPYNIFYSRVILPEPMMIFLSLGMIYFFAEGVVREYRGVSGSIRRILFILFAALALTQKAFPVFLSIPMAYLTWEKFKFNGKKYIVSLFYCFIVLLPFALWRFWISHFPEGIPPSGWLFNQGGIRFKGAFFYWIFAERLAKLILGYWGLPLLILGLILKPGREKWFFHIWFLAVLVYTTVFAAGNVTHDYYQIPFIPIISIFLAKGADFLFLAPRNLFSRVMCYVLCVMCAVFALAFSWYQVRDFYNIQGGVDLAGKSVDELTPKDALVLTGDSNDATLLYNCDRHGWTGGYASNFPNTVETIERIRQMGAAYYVTTKFDRNSDFAKYMLKNHSVLRETDQYIIFNL
jgi:4-amino-4-deoxy-L-arabinose transferase-like glycosyltransferase